MLMTSLFLVPTLTLIRWLRPFLLTHQLLKNGQMSEVWPFLLQSPRSVYSPLNLRNLTPILESLWTTPYCPFNFKFNAHFKSLVTRALLRINILKTLTGTNWGQQKETILNHIKVSYPVHFHVCSSHLVPQHLTIPYPETPTYPKLCPPHVKMASIDNLHEETEKLQPFHCI